ncbi:transcriptional regulator, GntR family [Ancylobacter novellus DSM 506]|uniref:Transcriptional regulator, GntR family n=1 Tax=Ancylobacter novellus (strain ATCC 8093 / DSM 506 / JCM 20403 / CCM 1077 / IAM 12100 / NBRC 12443 / NCIMB 10456) TaxID=639283 RepID=D7A9D2_ANCN5|nr:GntR family transcriptional regulator [Ancylobacter novellus]ADH90694.1 transcriptional regulator, GntR family [Ancylobacter novellus DSM 506]
MDQPALDLAPALAPEPRLDGETLQQWVFRQLRRAVMTGRFPPGKAVTIRGLADALGVSSMPVREALRRLVAERALVLLDNRRVRVPEMTARRFEELVAARTLLESEAAARALPRADRDFLRRLDALNRASDAAVEADDTEAMIETNLAFHAALYGDRPDNVLLPLIESVWLQIGPFMRMALADLHRHYPVDRHAEALMALEAKDEAALRRAIEADIRDGIGHLMEKLG